MKTLTGLMGAMILMATMTIHAGEDVGIDQAVKLLQSGAIQPFEQLNAAALARHPGGSIGETELDSVYGRYVYKVDLRDAQGKKWDVDIDASNGTVLSDKLDD